MKKSLHDAVVMYGEWYAAYGAAHEDLVTNRPERFAQGRAACIRACEGMLEVLTSIEDARSTALADEWRDTLVGLRSRTWKPSCPEMVNQMLRGVRYEMKTGEAEVLDVVRDHTGAWKFKVRMLATNYVLYTAPERLLRLAETAGAC